MTIEDWRAKIDALDMRLVDLLNERAECVVAVGAIKKARKMQILDKERERQILQRVLEENKGPLDGLALQRIFERVIEECRRIEDK